MTLDTIRLATEDSKFEGKLFLVGGAVREELLGADYQADFDIVTTESTEELAQFLAPYSSTPPVTYPRFGTAMLKIEGTDVELVTTRAESYDDDSRKPTVRVATLEEDAFRRDFTVNALMRNLHSGELLDLTGSGLDDLQKGILRTPRDPAIAFNDDPLRMMRAIRFRWRLGFKPAPGLYDAITAHRERLRIVSKERIRDEFLKMLERPSAPEALDDLMQSGLMEMFAPEFLPMVGCEQGNYHHLDVWNHTLLVVRNAGSENLTLTLSALFHDIGKPPTRSVDENGSIRFFGHESVGRDMTREVMRRLKFSERDIDNVAKLVGAHMRLGSSPHFSAAAARRLLRDMDGETDLLLDLVDADIRALRPGVVAMDLQGIRAQLGEVRTATPRSVLESPLTGQEIMELLDLGPGTRIGQLKSLLIEKVLEGELAPGDKGAASRILLTTQFDSES